MKKIIVWLLIITTIFMIPVSTYAGLDDEDTSIKEFEYWAMSPCISGGMTKEEMILQRAIQNNSANFYPLPELGENYYLAQTVGWFKNSGYSGKTDLGLVRYYLILMTDNDYIILDNKELYSDYTVANPIIYNLADRTVQPDKGERAIYAVYTYYPYIHSSWASWEECIFVTENKKLALKIEENANYLQTDNSPYLYEGKIYWGIVRSSYVYLRPMYFENGSVTEGTSVYYETSEITEANGYFKMNNSYEDYQIYGQTETSYFTMPGSAGKLYNMRLENSPQSTNSYSPTKDLVVSLYDKTSGVPKFANESRVYTASSSSYLPSSDHVSIKDIDENYYKDMGYLTPRVMVSNQYIIAEDGTIGILKLNSSTFSSTSYYNFGTYKNRLVVVRYRNGSSYIIKPDAEGVNRYYQALNYIYLNSKGEVTLGPDIELPTTDYSQHDPDQNGFYYNASSFEKSTAFVQQNYASSKDYFGSIKTNVFPDGRYVTGQWVNIGNKYEFFYNIYNPDGKMIAYGPTGYVVDTNVGEYEPFIVVESNTKFVVTTDSLTYSKVREFYRMATITNTGDNETVVEGISIGSKNLNPGVETDTVPVEAVIDFSKDELPIGFNLRDNVVDSDNLDAELREQINTIRLSDIVIIKSDDLETGVQNTGTTLDKFNVSDDSFGKCSILFYSNGQNFGWSCQTPNKLNAGTYNKYYKIGDKTVYVTIKIVEAPKNSGNVVVTF